MTKLISPTKLKRIEFKAEQKKKKDANDLIITPYETPETGVIFSYS